MLQSSAKLVSKLFTPDRVSAFARSCGVACLDHEALDVAVEQVVIIVSACAQCQKVLGCLGYALAEDLQLEVS